MRNLLARLLLTLASLAGAVALTAHIATGTVLNPERAGTVASTLLGSPTGQKALIDALTSADHAGATGHLTAAQQAQLRAALEDPAVAGTLRSALTDAHLRSDGTVDVTDAKAALGRTLTEAGRPGLARRVAAGPAHVELPKDLTARYTSVRETVSRVAGWALLAVIALAGTAILIARDHAWAMRRAGLSVLGAVAGSLLLFKVAPMVLGHFADRDGVVGTLADLGSHLGTSLGAGLVGPLVTAAVVGAGLVVVGSALGSLSRRTA